jgi:hypothetical protein
MKKACLLLLLIATPAFAQDVSDYERELGIAKLKQAYKLNDNKMSGGFYDLSNEPPVKCFEVTGVTGQKFFECPQPGDLKPTLPDAKIVHPERIVPTDVIGQVVKPVIRLSDPKQKNELDRFADLNDDTCKRHGLHRVTRGRSWHCRK